MKKLLYVLLLISSIVYAEDGGIKDWQGHDKGQHAEIGIVTTGACNLAVRATGKCFMASEAFGLAEQLYEIKTNPYKRSREAVYDFLAHTTGAYLGAVFTSGAVFYPSYSDKTIKINFYKTF